MFIGGYDGTSFLSIVEIYDPGSNEWSQGKPMTSGRSGHASAVSYHQCAMHCEHLDHNTTTNGSTSVIERPPS